ncbi:UDP-N-acetylmuramate dehydrogenase [Thalassotalea euphylliae]|uniref:UDP-N-acetylenolpyruvoylglucosamine reductase n=1 Tax=Thalassotalea euphylliae TaxID=1655234 RepID=A0A3E0TMD4_9GAMM|nr:UDP-N-acetylmuramate dehydrogenase [Thalassotalea euphylliae]REL25322.1 UDP-N-acetylmuramate dehydrogenase [Thalassotalea euphylliae]
MNNLSSGNIKAMNTMAINAYCDQLIEITSLNQLMALTIPEQPVYILGEGSNTLFVDSKTPTLIRPNIIGVKVSETNTHFHLNVGAGENWHQLVQYTVANNMFGLENLALIPGSVGAAPVQNIGAYGVEFANFCHSVEWFDFETSEQLELPVAQCQFSYRDSIFKQALKGKGVITSVNLSLPKKWQPVLTYAGLNELNDTATAEQVMNKVIDIRNSKLPDPKQLANVGSFFKNPVVTQSVFNKLQAQYPDIPFYSQGEDQIKLAAGWLIDQAGLKGYRQGDAAVHQKQALVLVNFGGATGQDIAALAELVVETVAKKFAVTLEPEVRIVGEHGERLLIKSESQCLNQ